MKSRILLAVILGSFGFAIFALVSNIQKAKNQMVYNSAIIMPGNKSEPKKSRFSNLFTEKKAKRRNYSDDRTSSPFKVGVALKDNKYASKINITRVPSLTNSDNGNRGVTSFSKSKKQDVSSGISDVSGMMATQAISTARGRGNYSDALSSGSLIAQNSGSGPLNVPRTTPTDVIIIDPGTDPDPGSMIPVGNGNYILLVLTAFYVGYLAFRKKNA